MCAVKYYRHWKTFPTICFGFKSSKGTIHPVVIILVIFLISKRGAQFRMIGRVELFVLFSNQKPIHCNLKKSFLHIHEFSSYDCLVKYLKIIDLLIYSKKKYIHTSVWCKLAPVTGECINAVVPSSKFIRFRKKIHYCAREWRNIFFFARRSKIRSKKQSQ